jgi:hypothetical protein
MQGEDHLTFRCRCGNLFTMLELYADEDGNLWAYGAPCGGSYLTKED